MKENYTTLIRRVNSGETDRIWLTPSGPPATLANKVRYALNALRELEPIKPEIVVGVQGDRVYVGTKPGKAEPVPELVNAPTELHVPDAPFYVIEALCWLHEKRVLTVPTHFKTATDSQRVLNLAHSFDIVISYDQDSSTFTVV